MCTRVFICMCACVHVCHSLSVLMARARELQGVVKYVCLCVCVRVSVCAVTIVGRRRCNFCFSYLVMPVFSQAVWLAFCLLGQWSSLHPFSPILIFRYSGVKIPLQRHLSHATRMQANILNLPLLVGAYERSLPLFFLHCHDSFR